MLRKQPLIAFLLFILVLIGIRIWKSGDITMIFLVWNIFLAAVPYWVATALQRSANRPMYQQTALFMSWLLFFPNSMYIITDLFHLHERPLIPLWFDLLILMGAAITGLVLGYQSLKLVQQWMGRHFPPLYLRVLEPVLFLLCGFGIYVGRYLRWNSWDVFTQPGHITRSVFHIVTDPLSHREAWLISGGFGVFLYLLHCILNAYHSSTYPKHKLPLTDQPFKA
jgi:uncharacterized membrane protein